MKQKGWLLRLQFSSDPDILSAVRGAVASLAGNLGFAEPESRALTRAVDEALANIICHAYGHRPDRPIELLCRRVIARTKSKNAPGLEIVLVDQGPTFDCKKFRGRSLDDVRPGGLGMHFIQSGADLVQYSRRDKKNRLRLVKYLPAQKPNHAGAKGEQ